MPFRDKPFEERVEESAKVRERFPDRLPVICERATNRGSSSTPELDKSRFLVPQDLTLAQLVYVIRRRLTLPTDQALFLYCGNQLPPTTLLLRELYSLYREPDGFLCVLLPNFSLVLALAPPHQKKYPLPHHLCRYLTYSGEAAFGGAQ